MWTRLSRLFRTDLAVDLGSANTRIAVPASGVLLDEPSVVALQQGSRRVLGRGTAVGKLARQMLGRTPESMSAVRPIQNSVIHDYELCEAMLRYFLQKVRQKAPGWKPRLVLPVPGCMTPVERRAILTSVERAGAQRVLLIPQFRAAALGAALPISEPFANLICDIGSGTTELAVMSLGHAVANRSLRTAGDRFDEAIVEYTRRHFSLKIGLQTAEQIKLRIGCAAPLDRELTTEVRGMDLAASVPRKALLTSEEVRCALLEPLEQILRGVQDVLEHCQPELVSDLAETGLTLSGGSAQLPGMDQFFAERLGIPVRVANDPTRTVIRGALIYAEQMDHWQSLTPLAEAA
jgi:rod shape-determining protein MreB and related proteins